MKRLLSYVLATTMLVASPAPGQQASEFSTLIADRVEITGDGRLVASGNVEAMQGEIRLKASRITYDESGDRLEIEGPIVLRQGESSVLLADSAALSPDLRNGLLRSARVVMDQQLQLASSEISRVDGRYTQLYNTVASSCEVCAAHPVPLWQIRAKRVVHDELEQQLHFEDATFEVAGIPVMYLPRFRLPDPTVKRATGFLTPSIRSTDELGFGFKLPYFIAWGDHKDVTLTPYLSANRTRTLELRYRQEFRNGDIELNSAASRDDIRDGLRAYLFAEGELNLPRDVKLEFDVETTSDETYLLDYDYSDKDRLDSAISLSQTDRDRLMIAEIIAYRSLRISEDNNTQPYLVGDAVWTQKFDAPWIGGSVDTTLDMHGHERRSEEDVIGRDIGRLSGWVDWRREEIGPWGIVLSAAARARLDHTKVNQDSNFASDVTQFTPYGIAEIRWPWARSGPGAGHVIEPIFQLVWSPDEADEDTPRDESTQLELDEGNLFGLSRFPAGDAQERGLRANVGVEWTRYDPTGWSMGVTVGQIFRQKDLGQFAGYESFDGTRSDWLTAVKFGLPNDLTLTNRSLFDQSFDFTKNELRLDWENPVVDVSTSYIWMEPSDVEDRPQVTNEWTVEGDWQITDRWQTAIDWRYDLELERSASARMGLEYRTECATFDFSIRRRFTSTAQLRPTTDYSFQVQLAGFGGDKGRPRPSRTGCIARGAL